jgi:gliding motility-associated-like protein
MIPNIFTPNKDGINDTFIIQGIVPYSTLTIYNRWGTIVYQSSNYPNNWDGGNCTDGVYYYIVNTPNNKQYKGTVTILR